jgi:hypothetical protein
VVEWKEDLGAAAWLEIGPVTAGSGLTTVTNSSGLGTTQQLYRVRVLPQPACE